MPNSARRKRGWAVRPAGSYAIRVRSAGRSPHRSPRWPASRRYRPPGARARHRGRRPGPRDRPGPLDGSWTGQPTDLDGRAHRTADLSLTASHLPGVTGAGAITAATLQVSYDDGATWTSLRLDHRRAAAWASTVKAPRSAAYVSLRATARDDAGNTVTQTVPRAYALK
ncbi:hypothetical protein [Streptomyces sp. IBSBF 2435]|uniref:hypothetical protein n=1 Tax=Streptomyces sp. IBSBF 2435 TaxID=2903531 RepID=UPI002FDBE50A